MRLPGGSFNAAGVAARRNPGARARQPRLRPTTSQTAVRRRGEVIPNTLLAHLAPLGWQHINLTGDYLWGAGNTFGPDGFRPLRGMAADPLAAAA